MRALTLILMVLVFVTCEKDDENVPVYTNDKFELTAASGWTLVNKQGIDSYVGYYRKGNYKINFDFGGLAARNLENIKNTPDLLYYEELSINGNNAKIIKENTMDGVLLSAYIDKGDGVTKNRLYTLDTSDDQLFIDIVKSHKFK